MNILIVDDEVYLSQKVSARLEDVGYLCDIVTSTEKVEKKYDTILLSTGLQNKNYMDFIKKNNDAVIILLAPYISDETVTAPIEAGAMDYVIKPFSMDEVLRKIKHFNDFRAMKSENNALREQNEFLFRKVKSSEFEYNFPLIINSTTTIDADKVAFDISEKENKELETIVLQSSKKFKYDEKKHGSKLLYFCGLHNLSSKEREEFFEIMKDKNIMLYQENCIEPEGFTCIQLKEKKKTLLEQDIMSLNDYVKYIVLNFQDKFPDTKLSEKLGISRKSLWEKRKKLGIEKKK